MDKRLAVPVHSWPTGLPSTTKPGLLLDVGVRPAHSKAQCAQQLLLMAQAISVVYTQCLATNAAPSGTDAIVGNSNGMKGHKLRRLLSRVADGSAGPAGTEMHAVPSAHKYTPANTLLLTVTRAEGPQLGMAAWSYSLLRGPG